MARAASREEASTAQERAAARAAAAMEVVAMAEGREEAREAAMAVEERAAAARVGEDGRHTCAGVIGIGGVSRLQEARRWKGQRPRSTGGIPETRPDRPMRGGPTTRRPPAGLHPPGSVSIGTGRRNGVKKSSWITVRVRTLVLWPCSVGWETCLVIAIDTDSWKTSVGISVISSLGSAREGTGGHGGADRRALRNGRPRRQGAIKVYQGEGLREAGLATTSAVHGGGQ